jgi:hypothetical protein
VQIYEMIFGGRVTHPDGTVTGGWPSSLDWFRNARDFQEWLDTSKYSPIAGLRIPLGDWVLRPDLIGIADKPIELDVNVPGLIVEQIIPVTMMVGLPVLLSLVAWRIGWAKTKRDHMILQFSGFIAVYFLLTAFGTAFRGRGMELYWPWDNPPVIT